MPIRILFVLLCGIFADVSAAAQAEAISARVTAPIDDARRVTLAGNVSPRIRIGADQGRAPADLPMDHMLLMLKSSSAQEAALAQLLKDQQDSSSPQYHKWLKPAEFGEQFGASPQDVDVVTRWLEGRGFRIENVAPSRLVIDFSGTAANVEQTFHTQIHRYRVHDELHWANSMNPQIPSALSVVVAGIVSLHDFLSKPAHQITAQPIRRDLNGSSGVHFVAPYDFATIYDLQRLWNAGLDGTGQTVALVARSNVNPLDLSDFRTLFGLPANSTQIILTGTNPGETGDGDEFEADLDAEWSGAVARAAQIDLVVSATTANTDGALLAAQYIVQNNVAPIMSMSFSACEVLMSASENQFFNNLWSQAASQGISVFVSSGDSGVAGCDAADFQDSQYGLSVSGIASTPYNVAVGGTVFQEGSGSYWGSNNQATLGSALGYIPEGYWTEFDSETNPNTDQLYQGYAGGGSGVSSIYSTPYWQTGTGVPASDPANSLTPGKNHRYVPDVSLNAAFGHDNYVLCYGRVCQQSEFYGVGGTSASSPSFAGLMAIVNQYTGSTAGNPNPSLYSLFGLAPAVFHSLQGAGSPAPCTGGKPGCSATNSSTTGTLPLFSSVGSVPGYNLSTGWHSVDAFNMVSNWPITTVQAAPAMPKIATPSGGSSQTQTYTFTFADKTNWQNITLTDVLINARLNALNACYFAIVPAGAASGVIYLVDNAGDAGGPYGVVSLPGSGSAQNSQCTINGAGSSVLGSGRVLTVTVSITFSSDFSGNRVVYTAAQDSTSSGWQALGTWNVPGSPIAGPVVGGLNPVRSTTLTNTYTFTFTDSLGWADLRLTDVLINRDINAGNACYFAFIPSGSTSGTIYVVDNAGDAGGPFSALTVPGSGSAQNSQCTINGFGASVSASGNTMTLTLPITFSSTFQGERIFYLAALGSGNGNSGWQAKGSINVP
ncbi:MAG TPA: S53 family peptidase [Bryobacteraceae bacterium]|nr:S53 family peptidase [Bryobacteraceae bacterium]